MTSPSMAALFVPLVALLAAVQHPVLDLCTVVASRQQFSGKAIRVKGLFSIGISNKIYTDSELISAPLVTEAWT